AQWLGLASIDLLAGSNTANVIVSTADIHGLALPGAIGGTGGTTISNIIGTGVSDTVSLTGEQLNNMLNASGGRSLRNGACPDTLDIWSNSVDLNTAGIGTEAQIVGLEVISFANSTNAVTLSLAGQSDGFTLTGSANQDSLTGSSGVDTITGGVGADIMAGGA